MYKNKLLPKMCSHLSNKIEGDVGMHRDYSMVSDTPKVSGITLTDSMHGLPYYSEWQDRGGREHASWLLYGDSYTQIQCTHYRTRIIVSDLVTYVLMYRYLSDNIEGDVGMQRHYYIV